METEIIATDDVAEVSNDSDVVNDNSEVVEEVVETTEGEVQPADGVTDPVKSDAERKAEAKWAWKHRNERRAREEAEAKAAQLEAVINTPIEGKPAIPAYENFGTNEEYNAAMAAYHENLTDWKMNQRDRFNAETNNKQRLNESLRTLEATYVEKSEKAAEKYQDYFDVVETNTKYTYAMKEAIFKSENSAEIAYHIGKNPEIHDKLMNSSPVDVALEIHKLDLRLKQSLSQKKVSSASAPINPVDGKGVGITKDPSKMPITEYMAWEKQQRIEKAKKRYGG